MGQQTRRSTPGLVCTGLLLFFVGCAQNPQEPETGENEEHLADGLQNYEKGAPMNGREIPNGPGIVTGQAGEFVIFRK